MTWREVGVRPVMAPQAEQLVYCTVLGGAGRWWMDGWGCGQDRSARLQRRMVRGETG